MTLIPTPTLGDRASAAGKWFATAFTRQNIFGSIKTLAWLVPLTILIWIYAERKQIDTTAAPGDPIPIEVISSDPNLFVQLLPDMETSVMAQLKGPRSWIDDVRRKMASQDNKASVRVTVPPNLTPGQPHDLETSELLATSPIFEHGVVPINCKPSRVRVFVDTFEEREIAVSSPMLANNLVGTPVFTPATVRVRAPAKAFADAEKLGPLTVEADLAGSGFLSSPGTHEAVVRVSSPILQSILITYGSEAVTYAPTTVRANFEVRLSAESSYVYRSMTVCGLVPIYLQGKIKIECPTNIYNVKVVGPSDKLADLQRPDAPQPIAYFRVTSDDKPSAAAGTRPPRRLEFMGLPEGVHVSEEDAKLTINFTVVEINSEN